MSYRPWVRLSSALPLLALLACKLTKDDEQTARALPTPEPASTTAPSRPVEVEPPRDRPKETTPRPTSENSPASPKPTATAATDAGATKTDAGTAPAPSASSAAPGTDKVTQCFNKCQGSLSVCISKPVPLDAGVPSLESMAECKKAFEDCRTACSP